MAGKGRDFPRFLWIAAVLSGLMILISCGSGGSGGQSAIDDLTANPGTQAGDVIQEPVAGQPGNVLSVGSPGSILAGIPPRQGSSLQLVHFGYDFEPGMEQHVVADGSGARFSPQWEDSGSGSSAAARAVYSFNTKDYPGSQLKLNWGEAPLAYSNLWIGFSHWRDNRWIWFNGPEDNSIELTPEQFKEFTRIDTGEMLVAVVLLGTDSALLGSIDVGDLSIDSWHMVNGDAQNSRRSRYQVTDSPEIKWKHFISPNIPMKGMVINPDGDLVYRCNDELVSLTQDGEELWVRELDTSFGRPTIGFDGTIYIAGDTHLTALNPDSSHQWSELTVFSSSSGDPGIGPDGSIYYRSSNPTGVVAATPQGAFRWIYESSVTSAFPEAVGFEGSLYKMQSTSLTAIAPDGTEEWTFPDLVKPKYNPVVAPDGTIYVGGQNNIYAIAPDGELEWDYPFDDYFTSALAVDAEGSVIFSTLHNDPENGKTYYVQALDSVGALIWTYECDADATNLMVDSRGYVVFSYGNEIICLTQDGIESWRYSTGALGQCKSLMIGSDGAVYFEQFNVNGYYLIALGSDGTGDDIEITGVTHDPVVASTGTPVVFDVEFTGIDDESTVVAWIFEYYANPGKSTDRNPAVVFPTRDSYDCQVQVSNAYGGVSVYEFTIDVQTSPSAVLLADTTFGPAPLSVNLDASDSSDPESGIVKYEWDYDGDGVYDQITVGSVVPYTFNDLGVHKVGLRVTDDVGAQDETALWITVDNDPEPSPWWNFGRTPDHSRRSPYIGATKNYSLFTFETGNYVLSSPAIAADGSLYFGCYNYNLYKLDPAGNEIWSFPTGGAVKSSPAIDGSGAVYFGSDDYKVYAVNADSSGKWTYTTGGEVESSPVLGADGTVYVGSTDGSLYAISSAGTLAWAYPTGGPVRSSPALDASGNIYFGSDDGNLYCLYPAGTLSWSFPTGKPIVSSPAVAADGTVYFGSNDNCLHAVSADGTGLWAFETLLDVQSSPAIGFDGTVYFGSNDGSLYALNPDGSLQWENNLADAGYRQRSPVIGADGIIYVTNHRYLIAVAPDGEPKFAYSDEEYTVSSPVIGPGRVVYFGAVSSLHAVYGGL